MRVRNVALVLLILLVAASLSPVLQIAYATSGSMEPAIPTDSLYVVNTMTDDPEKGDILMFDSPEKGRVTHRVIGVTADGGFITQGDANDVPDQTSREDAVRREQVIGVVPTVFGHPLVIAGSEYVVSFAITNPIAALLSLWLIFGAGFLFTTREMGVVEIRHIFLPIFAIAFVASIVFLSVGVSHDIGFLATDGPQEGNPELVPANENSTQTLHLATSPPPLFSDRIVSGTNNLRVAEVESYPNGTNVTVQVPAMPDTNVKHGAVKVYHYPPVLPNWILSPLHRIHPVVASVVTVSISYLPVYLLYLLLVDPRKRLRPFITRGDTR